MDTAKIDKDNFLIIGGTGRSGTTILSKIFKSHPEFASVPEWRFLIDPDGIIDFYQSVKYSWSPYLYNIKLKRLDKILKNISHSSKYYRYWRKINKILDKYFSFNYNLIPQYSSINTKKYSPNFKEISKDLIEGLKSFKYQTYWSGSVFLDSKNQYYKTTYQGIDKELRSFIYNIREDVLTFQNKRYYLEKNTWNILFYDKILELLPDSKLVHIYRNPLDVIASFSKQSWMPNDLVQCAHIYKGLMQRWLQVKSLVPEESYLEVSLDKLVEAPEKILKKICAFWGVEWHENLLAISLDKLNKNRWKKDIDPSYLEKINTIIIDINLQYGYV